MAKVRHQNTCSEEDPMDKSTKEMAPGSAKNKTRRSRVRQVDIPKYTLSESLRIIAL